MKESTRTKDINIIRSEKGRDFITRVKEAGETTYEEINEELAADFPTEDIEGLINTFLDEGIKILNKTKKKTKTKTKTEAKGETKTKSKTKTESKNETKTKDKSKTKSKSKQK